MFWYSYCELVVPGTTSDLKFWACSFNLCNIEEFVELSIFACDVTIARGDVTSFVHNCAINWMKNSIAIFEFWYEYHETKGQATTFEVYNFKISRIV